MHNLWGKTPDKKSVSTLILSLILSLRQTSTMQQIESYLSFFPASQAVKLPPRLSAQLAEALLFVGAITLETNGFFLYFTEWVFKDVPSFSLTSVAVLDDGLFSDWANDKFVAIIEIIIKELKFFIFSIPGYIDSFRHSFKSTPHDLYV